MNEVDNILIKTPGALLKEFWITGIDEGIEVELHPFGLFIEKVKKEGNEWKAVERIFIDKEVLEKLSLEIPFYLSKIEEVEKNE